MNMARFAIFLVLLSIGAMLGAVAVVGWAYQNDGGYRL